MVEIHDLHVRFHGASREAVAGIDLTIRDGEVVGRGLENRMLQNVGGAMGIRQKIIDLPDGTTVRLRTRAGMPEFIAEKPKGSALFYSHNIAYVTAGGSRARIYPLKLKMT